MQTVAPSSASWSSNSAKWPGTRSATSSSRYRTAVCTSVGEGPSHAHHVALSPVTGPHRVPGGAVNPRCTGASRGDGAGHAVNRVCLCAVPSEAARRPCPASRVRTRPPAHPVPHGAFVPWQVGRSLSSVWRRRAASALGTAGCKSAVLHAPREVNRPGSLGSVRDPTR